MKQLFYTLIILPVFFLSCSSPVIENISEVETGHNFQVQKLFYNGTFDLGRGKTLDVAVYADGCTCIKCGTKYHTNEFYSCYLGARLDESEFRSKVIATYRTMGYGKAAAYALENDVFNSILTSLLLYYSYLGYKKTDYGECIK